MSKAESDLLRRAQAGEMEAFTELFESFRPSIYAAASRLAGPDDVEDVVMETYLKAWQALPRFRGGSTLKTWVYRIAHNCAVDVLRRRERRKEVLLPETEAEHDGLANLPDTRQPAPDEAMARSELASEVRAALNELPVEHRTVLLLRFADGLSCREIAAVVGVSIGTVLSRLFYGKRKLRRILEKTGNEGAGHA